MRGILLDIEGTTTPIEFVYEVLFPYARKHLGPYIAEHQNDLDFTSDLSLLASEYARDQKQGLAPPGVSLVEYCLWLMDQDRKSTGLKSIQGKIWAAGYQNGDLKGVVFSDVPPALKAWHSQGVDVRIFSSGSVLAQKLLFSNTTEGDLTSFLRGYFDTNTGSKTSSESYIQIASAMDEEPAEIVFVSDVVAELDAARGAGMETLLCVRPGNRPQPKPGYRIVHSLENLLRIP